VFALWRSSCSIAQATVAGGKPKFSLSAPGFTGVRSKEVFRLRCYRTTGFVDTESKSHLRLYLLKYGGAARAVLCCAVLCCAVLCCAVLCCAALCCAVLRCAALRVRVDPPESRLPVCAGSLTS
jgi:hypothetical protein